MGGLALLRPDDDLVEINLKHTTTQHECFFLFLNAVFFSILSFFLVVYCVGFNEYAQREEKTIKKRGKVNRRNVCLFVCLFETERALFCRRSQRTERECLFGGGEEEVLKTNVVVVVITAMGVDVREREREETGTFDFFQKRCGKKDRVF